MLDRGYAELLRTPFMRSSQTAPWTNFRLCEVALLDQRPRPTRHGGGAWATGCFGTHVFSERSTSKKRVDSTLPPASWAPNVLYQWACSSVACIASSLSHRVTVSILPFALSPKSQSPQ